MSTTEQEILDRLYGSIREAKKWSELMANPQRLRMLVAKTDYEHLYDHLELVEGCARQMTAWREDTRWLDVSQTIGIMVQKLRKWATAENLQLFIALSKFMDNCEFTCRNLETAATHKRGAILPEVSFKAGSHVAPNLIQVKALKEKRESTVH